MGWMSISIRCVVGFASTVVCRVVFRRLCLEKPAERDPWRHSGLRGHLIQGVPSTRAGNKRSVEWSTTTYGGTGN